MIELQNVTKFYNNHGVVSLGLKGINLTLNRGEIVAICGESGSGKSTLLNVITKIDTFDEGEIYIDGEETSYFDIKDMDKFRKNKVGFIFQNYNIIESYDVLHNVMLPFLINGVDSKTAKKRAIELIDKVGLLHRINNKGSHLSGGEKQRCVIARALAYDCEILACDEPTGNLDSKTGEEIIKLIHEIAPGKIVLIVTHNFDEVKDIVTRKITLKDGEIASDEIYQQIPCDNFKYNESEQTPVSLKTTFKIANNNLKFTPRKTSFIGFVFMIISFSITVILLSLHFTISSKEVINYFPNKIKDCVYVSSIGNEIIDQNLYKDKICYVNPIEILSPKKIYLNYRPLNCIYEPGFTKNDLKIGKMPENDFEICINIPSYEEITDYYQKKVTIPGSKDEYIVVGVSTKGGNYSLFGNDQVRKYLKASCIKGVVTYEDTSLNDNFLVKYVKNGSNKIHIKDDKKIVKVDLKYIQYTTSNDYFNQNLSNFEISYNDVENYIEINDNFKFDEAHELLIYNCNPKRVINEFNNQGYLAVETSTYKINTNPIDEAILYGNIAAFVFVGLVLYLITYVVLKIAFKSKKNDYNILRTLGVTNKSLRHIVLIELGIVSIISALITLIILLILGNTIKDNVFFEGYKDFNALMGVIYFVCVILMSILIGHNFNKKLFKFSVSSSFEGKGK